jgi:glycosyltransferase involved in cell wall biosynthesis
VQHAKVALRFAVRLALIELPQLRRLRALIKREGIGLVLLNNDVNYHLVGILGARLTRTPCLCRKSGITPDSRLKRLLVPQVDLFLAISDATAQQQRSEYPGTRRLETVYAGIDLSRLDAAAPDPEIRAKLGVRDGTKLVGYVSRLQAGKGQSEFVEAAARILRHRDDVVFVIVGDEVGGTGALMQRLCDRVRALGVDRSVLFVGWRGDVPQVLAALDIFVHVPTDWGEGLGIANLEAMAMGKPSVVSANGGLADAVIDGVTGYVIPKGDIDRLATAIEQLLDDPNLAIRLGRAARARVEDLFDIRKNTRDMERFFSEYAPSNGVSARAAGGRLPASRHRPERAATNEVHR